MYRFAERMKTMEQSAEVMRKLFNATTGADAVNFSTGAPANETIDVDTIREICDDVLQKDGRGYEALQYNNPMGIPELREVVAKQLLPRRGIENADKDDVMIVQGGLETLNFACQLFINKGDVILVESPTFMHAVEIFEMFEAVCVGVECDKDGMLIDDLKEKCSKYDVKMIYVIPSFQNPSGVTMSLERRKEIAEYVSDKDIILLEDDPYVELRYKGEDLPAIKKFDRSGNVVYANSFSKIFSPGLRLGYVYADKEIIKRMFDAKTATNSHTAVLQQIICAEYFKRGYFEKNIDGARQIYKDKAEFALSCIKKYMPQGTRVNEPDGGLFVWLRLPEGCMDTNELRERADETGAAFVAGDGFFVEEGKGHDCMRLSFGHLEYETIEEGIKRLGAYIKDNMRS